MTAWQSWVLVAAELGGALIGVVLFVWLPWRVLGRWTWGRRWGRWALTAWVALGAVASMWSYESVEASAPWPLLVGLPAVFVLWLREWKRREAEAQGSQRKRGPKTRSKG
ncbi:MAG: hypothetical protein F4Z31_12455 [Gemmatimonadetes bacterium]|nr:hypothetical protein [Gemmatimonadota bacterium]MYE94514.1 hypothetical protein [Gemmatimonadota bacterium]MYJ10636.1 hypothetical protein [Gemmatimonadota bacterium]